MAGSGLRPGEAFGLTIDHVKPVHDEDTGELVGGNLQIERQLSTVDDVTELTPELKTDSAKRTVPITVDLYQTIVEHVDQFGVSEDGLVFTESKHHGWRRNRAADAFRVATKGLEDWPADARGWHALRHHYASVLTKQGLSAPVVQRLLGHASLRQTLETYAHVF